MAIDRPDSVSRSQQGKDARGFDRNMPQHGEDRSSTCAIALERAGAGTEIPLLFERGVA